MTEPAIIQRKQRLSHSALPAVREAGTSGKRGELPASRRGWRQVGGSGASEVSFLLGKERRPEETGSKEMTRRKALRGGQWGGLKASPDYRNPWWASQVCGLMGPTESPLTVEVKKGDSAIFRRWARPCLHRINSQNTLILKIELSGYV